MLLSWHKTHRKIDSIIISKIIISSNVFSMIYINIVIIILHNACIMKLGLICKRQFRKLIAYVP